MNNFPCFGETVPKLTSNFLALNVPFFVSSLLTKAVPGPAPSCHPRPVPQSPKLRAHLGATAWPWLRQGGGHCCCCRTGAGWDRPCNAASVVGASLAVTMLLPLPLSTDPAERGPEPLRGAGRGGSGGWRRAPAPLGSGLRRRLGYAGGDGGLSPAGSGIR